MLYPPLCYQPLHPPVHPFHRCRRNTCSVSVRAGTHTARNSLLGCSGCSPSLAWGSCRCCVDTGFVLRVRLGGLGVLVRHSWSGFPRHVRCVGLPGPGCSAPSIESEFFQSFGQLVYLFGDRPHDICFFTTPSLSQKEDNHIREKRHDSITRRST